MSCDHDDFIHVEDKDEDDKQMTATIEQAQEDIRPILRILQNSCIQDAKGQYKRQIEYSVNEFITTYPDITHLNFYEKQFDLERKIKDARCFFMLLQQLQPRTSRKVNPQKRHDLALIMYLLICMHIKFIFSTFCLGLYHCCAIIIFSYQDSMWKLPGELHDNIKRLTEAVSPVNTYVRALIYNDNDSTAEAELGKKRMKQLCEYERLFYKTLQQIILKREEVEQQQQQQQQAPQINQTPDNNMMLQDTSIGNTTTSYSQTSMQRPTSMTLESMISEAPSCSVQETVETLQYKSCISPISHSQNSTKHLDCSSNSIMTMSLDDDTSVNMQYSPLLYLQNCDDSYSFFGNHADDSIVPMAKSFHAYGKKDLQPVQCMASFLYLVFRDPLAYEVPFFKAGFRAFDENKQEYQQVIMENKRRYVTSYGPGTNHYR